MISLDRTGWMSSDAHSPVIKPVKRQTLPDEFGAMEESDWGEA